MLYNIENDKLKISISNIGGELHSIKGKNDNTEYLWNGDETFWKFHAPILFPIIGKVVNGEYKVNENSYKLPQHGFARELNFEVIEQTSNSISFELQYSKDTLKVYPFKFSLIIKYSLLGDSIQVDYLVKNLDTDMIIFSIGAHPGFMCPILPDEKFEDYYFEFSKPETINTMCLVSPGYFTREEKPYLKNENIIKITPELFKGDALVFNNLKSNKIWLKSKNHSKSIEFDFSGFPYLALWSKPTGAPFVCIEPWFGHADFEDFEGEFKEKAGVQELIPNEIFKCTQIYTIHQ